MNKKRTYLPEVFFLIFSTCFGQTDLQLNLLINKDTVKQFQSIDYEIQWHNESNDTFRIRDDWSYVKRPKLEARNVGSEKWAELWRSENELVEQCYFKDSYCGYGIRSSKYLLVPPKSSITISASYSPIWENIEQKILTPGNKYEFRFILPKVLEVEGVKIRQKGDCAYIKSSSEGNKHFVRELINSDLNIYDLFKSWSSCGNDSSVVAQFYNLGTKFPNNDMSQLIELKIVEWDWLTMSNENFAVKYSKESLLDQLKTLRKMLENDFYDKGLIKEMIYENLERGLRNGYDIDEYSYNVKSTEER